MSKKQSRMEESIEVLKQVDELPSEPTKEEEEARKYEKLCLLLTNDAMDGKVLDVPLAAISLGKNVRKKIDLDSDAMRALMGSLEIDGLIHPITINGENGRPTLKAGFRRYKAMEALGWKTAKVTMRTKPDTHGDVLQAIENILREDLEPLDYCDALRMIKSHEKIESNEMLAERVGLKDRGLIGYYLKASDWPEDVKQTFRDLGMGKSDIFRICRRKESNDEATLRAMILEPPPARQGAEAAPEAKEKIEGLLSVHKVDRHHQARVRKAAFAYATMEPNERKALRAFIKSF